MDKVCAEKSSAGLAVKHAVTLVEHNAMKDDDDTGDVKAWGGFLIAF